MLERSAELARRRLEPVRTDRRGSKRAAEMLVIKVDLVGARPPVWPRVHLPSTLRLDQVHDLLQLLFGWTDSHLHGFALGSSVWDRDAEIFLCSYDVEEGKDDGIPTGEVRMDEVLGLPGDVLRYVYDYGDEWTVALKLEKVVEETCGRVRSSPGGTGLPLAGT